MRCRTVVLDAERQKKARQYARIQRRLFFVDLALGSVYVIAWLIFGWSIAVKNALSAISMSDWFLVAGVAFVFAAILFVIDLPLSYYSGFVLPHRFELSTQTISGWISDQVKEVLIGGVFGFIVIEVIYAVLRAAPEQALEYPLQDGPGAPPGSQATSWPAGMSQGRPRR